MAAFVKTAIPNRYIGASTDDKPTASVGSLCYETDTCDWYVTADGTTWTLYKGASWLTS